MSFQGCLSFSYHLVLSNIDVCKHEKYFTCFFYMSCFLFTCLTNCRLRHVDCYVMLATSLWWCWRLCLSCARYVNIYRTHTQCCKHFRVSVVAVVQRSITSVSHTKCCFLDGSRHIFVESCWVCVRKATHAQVHSFTHLVTLLKFWWPNSPLTIEPSPHHWLNRLSPRTTQKHQASHFMLCCLQEDQSTFMLVNWRVWPGIHLGTDSPQKLCRGFRPFPLYWLRKLCREVRQTPSSHPYLPQKIA